MARKDYIEIPFDAIRVGEKFENPRKSINEEQIDGLAQNIKSCGLLQPIIVRPRKKDGEEVYDLIAGFRRMQAITSIRNDNEEAFNSVPARLVRSNDDKRLLLVSLTENAQREKVPIAEVGESLVALENLKMSRADIARELGRPMSWVSSTINAYERATADLLEANAEGALSNAQTTQVSQLSPEKQKQISNRAKGINKDKTRKPREKKKEIKEDIKEAQREEGIKTGFKTTRTKTEVEKIAKDMFTDINMDENNSFAVGFVSAIAWFLGEESVLECPYDIRSYLTDTCNISKLKPSIHEQIGEMSGSDDEFDGLTDDDGYPELDEDIELIAALDELD